MTATGSEITIKAYVSVQGEAGDSLYLDGLSIIKVLPGNLGVLTKKVMLEIEQDENGNTSTLRFQIPAANEIHSPRYTLQQSQDLSTWSDINFTQIGTNATAIIPFVNSYFYRIKLTPTD